MVSKRTILTILFVVILGFASWRGYEEAYSMGLAKGYTAGYEAGLSSFPRLDISGLTLTESGNTIYIGQLTVTGEQHIIDTIKNLPSIDSIISIEN